MQQKPPGLRHWATNSWRMAVLGWLSWPAIVLLGVIFAWLRLVQIGSYIGIGVMFAGLSCCLWAALVPQRPFWRAFALVLLIVGVWACLGKLTFALPSIIGRW